MNMTKLLVMLFTMTLLALLSLACRGGERLRRHSHKQRTLLSGLN